MPGYRFSNDPEQRAAADQVRQEDIGDQKRDQEEYSMFNAILAQLFRSQRSFIQFFPLRRTPFNPGFNPAEDHLEEYRLGTNPSAEDPAENHREQHNEDHEGDQRQYKEVKVLRPEDDSEKYKLAFQNIQEHQLLAIQPDKGRGEQQRQKEVAEQLTVTEKLPLYDFRVEPFPFFSVLSNRTDLISELCRTL